MRHASPRKGSNFFEKVLPLNHVVTTRPVASALQERVDEAQRNGVHVEVEVADLEGLVLGANAEAAEVRADARAISRLPAVFRIAAEAGEARLQFPIGHADARVQIDDGEICDEQA